jgi:hypothetical protein
MEIRLTTMNRNGLTALSLEQLLSGVFDPRFKDLLFVDEVSAIEFQRRAKILGRGLDQM